MPLVHERAYRTKASDFWVFGMADFELESLFITCFFFGRRSMKNHNIFPEITKAFIFAGLNFNQIFTI
ncbi:hypothetical protein D770_04475 [Flammeovirgaceae bacterium 311]|nr:hypothetical protein D770_04475 [Flammeovirgaceae bacterium 311]